MTKDLEPGRTRLQRIAGAGTLQVASATHVRTGELIVLLRIGDFVAELEVEAAAKLGDALIIEAALIRSGEVRR